MPGRRVRRRERAPGIERDQCGDHAQADQGPGGQKPGDDDPNARPLPRIAPGQARRGDVDPGEGQADGQLDDGVPGCNRTATMPAPAAQDQPAQDWQVIARGGRSGSAGSGTADGTHSMPWGSD
jgi:hypothetical protein